MFYVKGNPMKRDCKNPPRFYSNGDVEMNVSADNVFFRCPRCGKEVGVNLNVLCSVQNVDFNHPNLWCSECEEKLINSIKRGNGTEPKDYDMDSDDVDCGDCEDTREDDDFAFSSGNAHSLSSHMREMLIYCLLNANAEENEQY